MFRLRPLYFVMMVTSFMAMTLATGCEPSPEGSDAGGLTCSDGVDNDSNGLTDCEEPACRENIAACDGDPPAGSDQPDNDNSDNTPIVELFACCIPSGGCLPERTLDECTAAGGTTFEGACDAAACPQPAVVCCLNGACVDTLTESQCLVNGGAPQAAGSTCAVTDCQPPQGACCNDVSCLVQSETDCGSAGGTYLGDDSTCDPDPCAPTTGACCQGDGSCVVTTQIGCTGFFLGLGADCAGCQNPAPGACCTADGTCLDDTLPPDCLADGGLPQSPGVTCAGFTCPATGACCVPGVGCGGVSELLCQQAQGTYFGDGSDCADVPCVENVGACCNLPVIGCAELSALACTAFNGTFQGTGTQCTDCPG